MSEIRRPADDAEHDAWLREALRHAPDAAAEPPGVVNEVILARARAAVAIPGRPRRSSPFLDRAAAFWSWLARPPVAAGFASVMAATLVGLMWWDRPIDQTLPRPESTRAAAPASHALLSVPPRPDEAPPAARSEALSPKPAAPAPARLPAERDKELARSTPPPDSPAGALTGRVAPTDALAGSRKDDPAREPIAAARTAPAPFPAGRPSDDAAVLRDRTGPSTLAKRAEPQGADEAEARIAAAPAVADLKAPDVASAIGAKAAGNAVARANLQPRAAAAPPETGDALDSRSPAPSSAQAFAGARQRSEATIGSAHVERAASARPMAALLASLVSENPRWSRQTSGGERAAVDAALQSWLARVDATSAGNWRAAPLTLAEQGAAPTAEAGTLVLLRDGRPAATVRLGANGVRFESALDGGTAWFADLAPEAAAGLEATLPAR